MTPTLPIWTTPAYQEGFKNGYERAMADLQDAIKRISPNMSFTSTTTSGEDVR